MSDSYHAFISYSHRDEIDARWLHRRLESYRVPKRLQGEEEIRRLIPIFRDREELPTAVDLGQIIEDALDRSRYMIVLCSPESAKSRWVDAEIRRFKQMGKANKILACILSGVPNASDGDEPEQECFPASLRFEVDEAGELTGERTEPIAADLREIGDGRQDGFLKLAAGLLGVGFDQLKRRHLRRRRQQMTMLSLGTSVLALVFGVLAVMAWQASNEANLQRLAAKTNGARAVAGELRAKENLAGSFLRQAYQAFEDDDWHRACTLLVRTLRIDPDNWVARDRLLMALAHTPPIVLKRSIEIPKNLPTDKHVWDMIGYELDFQSDEGESEGQREDSEGGGRILLKRYFSGNDKENYNRDLGQPPHLLYVWEGEYNVKAGKWNKEVFVGVKDFPEELAFNPSWYWNEARPVATVTVGPDKKKLAFYVEKQDGGGHMLNAQGPEGEMDLEGNGYPVVSHDRKTVTAFNWREVFEFELPKLDEPFRDSLDLPFGSTILCGSSSKVGDQIVLALYDDRNPGTVIAETYGNGISEFRPPYRRVPGRALIVRGQHIVTYDGQLHLFELKSEGTLRVEKSEKSFKPFEFAKVVKTDDWSADVVDGNRLGITLTDGRVNVIGLNSWTTGYHIAPIGNDRLYLMWHTVGGDNLMFRILDPKTGFDLLGPSSGTAPDFFSVLGIPQGYSQGGARLHFVAEEVRRVKGKVVRLREESHMAIPLNANRLPEQFLDRVSDWLNYETSETGALETMLEIRSTNVLEPSPWLSRLESLYAAPE